MSHAPDVPGGWGTYAPAGTARIARGLARLGLGHGPGKRLLRGLWRAGGGERPLDVVYGGLRFRLHPGDNSTEAKMAFGSAVRDRRELEWLAAHMAPGGVFVDVGANIGYYALTAVALGAARALAIEPNPVTAQRLRANVRANRLEDRVEILAVAAGARPGTARLARAADLGAARIAADAGAGAVEVPVRPLADLLAARSVDRVEALKIDVEGMEDAVLGALLEAAPPGVWPRLVVLEHAHRAEWQRDLLAILDARGYEPLARSRSNTLLGRVR